ncbi:Alpha-ketoglutarate-dependent dioxygenase alkB 6 [Mortierella sp. GBA30]|nr:Alpha-ketoglutarate-dependent dioxygenase alkB 6 [Mortierella sp. GBA30]
MTLHIGQCKIRGAPPSVYYIPDFITPAEEQVLVDKVLSAPKPKWVQLKNRRLQNWGGIVSAQGMIAEPLPPWLTCLYPRLREAGVFEGLASTQQNPNHCLVNEYLAGQGIMPHTDGPAYLPTVATVSLSSHCVLDFYKIPPMAEKKNDHDIAAVPSTEKDVRSHEPEFSLLVQPRSLLVLKEDVYNNYMHGIREIATDDPHQGNIVNLPQTLPEISPDSRPLERSTRISLTFRIVQKTKLFLKH